MAPGYKGITASNFLIQQSLERFPNYDALQHILGIGILLPVAQNDGSDPSQAPNIAHWRSNLVALSQKDNLYFTAYLSDIHVTIPRGLKQIIPGTPDLILDLPVSSDSLSIGGFIDPNRPHCVNNILVGDLGSKEILLLACDDGDIIAFYVHAIANAIKTGASGNTVTPFFHENIKASAWGLAIHGPSRLIAASCNLRQITVFMPAYASKEVKNEGARLPYRLYNEGQQLYRSPSDRKINIKKTFLLGKEGHNVPSLSFASNPKGDAESILATDISGNIWIFDLYSGESKRLPSIHENSSEDDRNMGWGVLVLPLKCFKRTDELQEALGGTQNLKTTLSFRLVEDKPVKVFDIGVHNYTLRGAPMARAVTHNYSGTSTSPLVLEDDSEEDSDGDSWTTMDEKMSEKLADILNSARERETRQARSRSESPPHALSSQRTRGNGPPMTTFHFDLAPARLELTDISAENLVNMHHDDLAGIRNKDDLHRFLIKQSTKKPLRMTRKDQVNPDDNPFLDERTAILRTYQYDIELLAPNLAVPRTVCCRLFRNDHAHHGLEILRGFERLNLLVSIPQLSLVIVASQAGRAALITLTRPDDHFSINGPVMSFHVDQVVPSPEHMHDGLWPRRALLGLAVSPMQTEATGIEAAKRWRLMMHYYDHTILSYELSRDEESDGLMVL